MRLSFVFVMALAAVVPGAAHPQTAVSTLSPESLRDLGPRWWQWRISLPELAVPAKDAAGHFCDVGQSGETWFLAGILSFGAPSEPLRRTCVVPAGRRLFFPVATTFRITHGDVTCDKAQAEVSARMDRAEGLNATLDGVDVMGPGRGRWGTGGTCFPLNLAADGPSSTLTAAADGYWLSVGPLPVGRHTLAYGGAIPSGDNDDPRVQATIYELEIR